MEREGTRGKGLAMRQQNRIYRPAPPRIEDSNTFPVFSFFVILAGIIVVFGVYAGIINV